MKFILNDENVKEGAIFVVLKLVITDNENQGLMMHDKRIAMYFSDYQT